MASINKQLEKSGEMLEKLKEHFKEAELACSKCGKSIEEGERFFVTLILPTEKQMPVGRLDKMLAKRAVDITCSDC